MSKTENSTPSPFSPYFGSVNAPLQQFDRTFVRFRGRKLSYFSGCDYFRLASHPRILAAMAAATRRYGLSVSASRLTTGNHPLYEQLETCLADFFGAPSALHVSSGYATNLVVAQALAGTISQAIIDDGAHPSLRDAAAFLNCRILTFRHCDPEALAQTLGRVPKRSRILLLTDGLFASDGLVAPLADYLKILPSNALVLVDDAHAAGILGSTGKGSLEYGGVSRRRIIQTMTLSKAFGVYGGTILGPAKLRDQVLGRSSLFIGSTPLPLPLAAASIAAVKILRSNGPRLRRCLSANASRVRSALRAAGFSMTDSPAPLIPLTPANPTAAAKLKHALLGAGIYPPFLKYPGSPPDGYFRFVISSEHTITQLDNLVRTLKSLGPYSSLFKITNQEVAPGASPP